MILLVGLAWDAVLHKIDPELASRESVFSATVPAHILFAGGMLIVVLGVLLFLLGRAQEADPLAGGLSLRFVAPAAGLIALVAVAFALAASTGSLGGPAHSHGDVAAVSLDHQDSATDQGGSTNTASSSLPGVTHAHGEAVAISASDLAAAAKLVAEVKTGSARLNDVKAAQAEGYKPITGGISGLVHYHNQTYNTDGRIVDPERPEELMYLKLRGGEMKLVGVMFLMPSGQAGPRVGGALTAWHAHDNLCFNLSSGVITAFTDAKGLCPKGTAFFGKTPEMMHVWVVDNPYGVFSEDMEPAALIKLLNANATTGP